MADKTTSEKPPLILVVDDDKSMRMLLRLALEQEGYRVIEAYNGEACLSAYQSHHPDAVLLDAVMPLMDGFTCCQVLRNLSDRHLGIVAAPSLAENTPLDAIQEGLPILMITVLDDPDSVDRAFDSGATDYITKPIHWAVLRHRVRRLLRQSFQARYINTLLKQLETVDNC